MCSQRAHHGQCMLVTGGAGFIGSHVVERAIREGFHVTVVDNMFTGRQENVSPYLCKANYRFFQHDIQNPFPVAVSAGVPADDVGPGENRKYNCIFHLACPASPVHYQSDSIGTILTCVNGTNHVLQLATQHDCPVLIASTSEVYGDPEQSPQREDYWGHVNCCGVRSCYDEGKRCAEALCFDYHRRYRTKIRVARVFNTYGPRMCFDDGRVISNFLVQALRGADITIYGTGEQTRSFQFIDDLLDGLWRLVFHPTEIGPVNLGTADELTVREVAERVLALVPGTLSRVVFQSPVADDPKQRRPDTAKAKAVLGWAPKVSIDDGLRRTIEEFRARMLSESGK